MATTKLEKISSSSSSSKFTWKINKFSKFTTMSTYSDVFSVNGFKWKACICPKGREEVYDHISLYLVPVDLTKSVDTQFSFAITSQKDRNNTLRFELKHNFHEGTIQGFGWTFFMPLVELHDRTKGYIVDDTCVISIDVTCLMKEPKEEEEKDSTLKQPSSSSNPLKSPTAKPKRTKTMATNRRRN
ncbi:hypothetical protein C5167_040760 [Papaver somniferum]|uniref:MATH domain-containing protein n=1 Tax=Papaver somniferum TaxID=3469 RepID=A0A4Y7IJC6_PAPSO|nr:ubiquitin carboxyl-terminal hydrolase 13-like [Papaver somniferum]RZC47812.1 hypothetical protein C5167_040760 [Papaver somniferum]